MVMLGTQDVMMQVSDPLPAGNRHIEIFYSILDMRRYAVPEEGGVLVNNVSRRRISELSIHTDLFKFGIERVRLPRVHRIAKLSHEIGRLDQSWLQGPISAGASRPRRKTGHLDRGGNPGRVDTRRISEALKREQLGSIDVIRRESRIRCAARKSNSCSALVHHELGFSVAAQDTPHIADIVQQTCDDQMAVISRFYSLRKRHSLQDVTTDHRDL